MDEQDGQDCHSFRSLLSQAPASCASRCGFCSVGDGGGELVCECVRMHGSGSV